MFRKHYNLILLLAFLACLLGFSLPGKAQKPDIYQVESNTYRHYLDQDWDSLLDAGSMAILAGLDYYYLRVRMGIASYQTEDYRTAAHHFEQALRFKAGDSLALEYLYFSHLLANRWPERQHAAAALPRASREKHGIDSPDYISHAFSNAGFQLTNSVAKANQADINGKEDIYGEVTLYGNAYFLQQGFRHEPLPSLSVIHHYSFLAIDMEKRISYFHMPDSVIKDTSDRFKIYQQQYYLSGSFYAGKGWTISPAFHLIRLQGESFTYHYAWDSTWYWANPGWDTLQSVRYVYTHSFPEQSLSQTNTLYGLAVEKNFRKWNLGVSSSYSTLLEEKQFQSTARLSWFPRGNTNNYLGASISYFTREVNAGSGFHPFKGEKRYFFGAVAGTRVTKDTWLEGNLVIGNQSLSNEYNGFIVYNTPESSRFKAGLSLLKILNGKFELLLNYRFFAKEAMYWYYASSGRIKGASFQYSNHSITGGFKWKI